MPGIFQYAVFILKLF